MSAGEVPTVLLIGADRKQASILRRYCQGLIETPLLRQEVVRATEDLIEFRNGAVLEVVTNDVRLIRGRSAVAVIGSECCTGRPMRPRCRVTRRWLLLLCRRWR